MRASSRLSPRMHEPAAQTVIGKTYPDTGFEQGRAVLQALARHPATARHVATKLARHFVADDPPLTLVDKLSKRFLETEGDLKEMAKTLIAAPESWVVAAAQAQAAGRMDDRHAARHRQRSARHQADPAGAEPAGRAAVAAAGAQRLCRPGRGLDRRHVAAARHRHPGGAPARQPASIPRRRSSSRWGRSPRRRRARPSIARRAGRRHWRSCSWRPNSNAGETMTLDLSMLAEPPRAAARLRHAVRLGLCAQARARRGPRSAPAHHRAARRARRAGGGGAGRRSGLDRLARRQGAHARGRDARGCRSTPSSPSTRRCRICTASTGPAPPPSCTRPPRPTGSAPISTARTCSKAACCGRAPPRPAGSTAP